MAQPLAPPSGMAAGSATGWLEGVKRGVAITPGFRHDLLGAMQHRSDVRHDVANARTYPVRRPQ
jgi:hypothetical protein